jgi:hypothetical protein
MAQANFADLLKAAQDAGFSNCPPGTYDVQVVKAEAKTTASGKDMLVVTYQIVGGPHGGRKVPNNFVISPENANALGFFFRHMAAMGLDTQFFAANPSPQQVASALVGRNCRIEVGTRTWNGEEREDVKKVMAPTTGAAGAPIQATPTAVASAPAIAKEADPMAPQVPF